MSENRTRLAYKVITFLAPSSDRDLTVRVNDYVKKVEGWARHMGPARVVSLSNSSTNGINRLCTLTIEYTEHDTSELP